MVFTVGSCWVGEQCCFGPSKMVVRFLEQQVPSGLQNNVAFRIRNFWEHCRVLVSELWGVLQK